MVTLSSASPLRLSAHTQLVETRHGWMLANPNDFYQGRALLEYGECAELESAVLRQLLVRPGIVVEVGANIGVHTVTLAREAQARRRVMVAFEPQPLVFQNLCANLAANGIVNVLAWPYACGAEDSTLHFSPPDYFVPGDFGAVSMQTEAGPDTIPVPCVRLDDALRSHAVSLLKLDVEGFELKVLQGAVETLTQSRPTLYLANDWLDRSRALIEWLWRMDYRMWWHLPPLFNPANFRGRAENIFGTSRSSNMLALPRELSMEMEGFVEVTDSTAHALIAQAG
ncbi:FkbM family methyltransferase [Paraburkholderia sp. BCC1886]|uniref:FkbM family methyltransferase n=1 Tax=Paraburkholderia sp. BCC1886 TaxID=2562670 RepID=UPI001C8FD08F|nr:FkbM family methyltransferase [Paraburkholderia sp. BCC1886]